MASKTSGGCLLTMAPAGVTLGIYAVSRDALVLLVWVLGWGLIVWTARRVPRTPKPTPPQAPEGAVEEEPQVTCVQDPNHPNRWIVQPTRKTETP